MRFESKIHKVFVGSACFFLCVKEEEEEEEEEEHKKKILAIGLLVMVEEVIESIG